MKKIMQNPSVEPLPVRLLFTMLYNDVDWGIGDGRTDYRGSNKDYYDYAFQSNGHFFINHSSIFKDGYEGDASDQLLESYSTKDGTFELGYFSTVYAYNDDYRVICDNHGRFIVDENGGHDSNGIDVIRAMQADKLDKTFRRNGHAIIAIPPRVGTSNSVTVTQMAVDGQDRIYLLVNVYGKTSAKSKPSDSTLLVRLDTSGQIDRGYGNSGMVDLGPAKEPPYGSWNLNVDQRGRANVVLHENTIVRFRENGSRDQTFGNKGIIAVDKGTVRIDQAGRILVGASGDDRVTLTRFNIHGQLDSTFGVRGKKIFSEQTDYTTYDVQSLLPQRDGTTIFQVRDHIYSLDDAGNIKNEYQTLGVGVADVLEDGSFIGKNNIRLIVQPQVVVNKFGGLYIRGTNDADDYVAIKTADSRIRVSLNGKVKYFQAANIKAIHIDLGDGNNVVTSSVSNSTIINTGAGNDLIRSGLGDDTITTSDGDDTVYAGVGNDQILGGGGSDSLSGEAGNDYLVGNEGADTMSGGDGYDEIDGFDYNKTRDAVDGGKDYDILYSSENQDDQTSIETLYNDPYYNV